MGNGAQTDGESLSARLLVAAVLTLVVLCHAIAVTASSNSIDDDEQLSSTDLLDDASGDTGSDTIGSDDRYHDSVAIVRLVSRLEPAVLTSAPPAQRLTSLAPVVSLLRAAPKTSPPKRC